MDGNRYPLGLHERGRPPRPPAVRQSQAVPHVPVAEDIVPFLRSEHSLQESFVSVSGLEGPPGRSRGI